MATTFEFVMPGLVPGIHVYLPALDDLARRGCAGIKPGHDVDGEHVRR